MMLALYLTCGFEYARLCSKDQFFQLACSRGQCTCHATRREQAGGGISAQHRGLQKSEKGERKGWQSCSGVCVCVCVCMYACLLACYTWSLVAPSVQKDSSLSTESPLFFKTKNPLPDCF